MTRTSPPEPGAVQATLDELWVYPVKSCGSIRMPHARLLATGLAWDRHWMVVDDRGEFLSQREWLGLALIRPELTPLALVLRAPGLPELALPLATGAVPSLGGAAPM